MYYVHTVVLHCDVKSVSAVTHQPSLRLDERPVDAIHLVVQSAGVTQVVAGTIPPPEGG